MNKKISDKDKRDWQSFVSNNDKLIDKDLYLTENQTKKEIVKTIDLHGFSLEDANNFMEKFILKCFKSSISKIIVITGKGLRSKSEDNPYISKDLSILKYSVPDFLKSRSNLMKIIKKIEDANIKDGGKGAFYVYLKKH